MKRFLSLLITIVMVLSLIPVGSLAAEGERTVYVDAKNGNNNNDGLSETAPVKTLAQAYSCLSGASAGRIVFLSTTEFSASYNAPTHTIPITLTSKTGAEGFRSAYNVYFRGPTTLENMTVTNYSTNSWTLLTGGGHKFTIGKNVTSVAENDYYFCPTGGSNSSTVSSIDMTIQSGTWRNIYVVAHSTGTVSGDCTVNISGCTVENSVAMGYKGNAKGNTTIHITNTYVKTLYACSTQPTGSVGGDVTITLGEGAEVGTFYTESGSMSVIKGTNTLILDGGSIDTIKKSSENTESGATALFLNWGTVKNCEKAADTVSINIPQDKTLTVTGDVVVDTLEAAGTLNFSGKASVSATTVTGSVNCTVADTVLAGHSYVNAPADAAISFPESSGILSVNGQWTLNGLPVEEDFDGIILTATPGVTVKLYTGYSEGEVLTPTKTVSGTVNAYYYEITPGKYRYISSGTGYYKVEKCLYVTQEKLDNGLVVDATPPVKSGEGWEQTSVVQLYTDEFYRGGRTEDMLNWPEFSDVFNTPYFTEERTAYQMTTQAQMEAFVDQLDDENDNLYTFSSGRSSGYDFDIPVVIITKTDLTGVTTLDHAADIMGQEKPTIFYRAHMHGSEPASCDAALAILQRLDGQLGETVLDNINVIIMPRNNPDGASTYTRNLTSGIDPNGDLLKAAHSETEAYLNIFDLFQPEIILDGHEFTTNITYSSAANSDALIGLGFAVENSQQFQDAYIPMITQVRQELTDHDMYYRYYESVVNHNGASVSRSHASLQGTMFVLIETPGIRSGTSNYPRRVVTQVIAMQTMIEYVAANADTIQTVVDAEKQRIITRGATYEEDDVIYLELDKTSDSSWTHPGSNLAQDGTLTKTTVTPKLWNKVLRTRVAPTAYLIPAGASYTDDVLALMDKHNITYEFIPAGSQVLLQQYQYTTTDDATTVSLGNEETVTFGKGAYVFCKNQVKGILLSALMEPDVTKSQASTLVGQGLIPAQNGTYPIYRYCYDLNETGFIDYTTTTVEAQTVTVYLDGVNGLDTNDGLTSDTPVKTLEQAYGVMDQSLRLAAEGSSGTLIVSGLYDLGAQQSHLPGADYPVTITGNTAADGFLFTGGATQAERTFEIHGDTTFRNITFKINNNETFNYIVGNGYKLTMDVGVTTVTAKANAWFTLFGGDYDYTDVNSSTDLTVRSGSWRSIYAGGYRASVTGLAKADISDCYVYHSIAPTYCGNIGASEIRIENTTVAAQATSAIYGGPISYNATYKVGAILGESKLILGDNVQAAAIYAGSRERGNTEDLVRIVIHTESLATPIYSRPHADSTGAVTDVLVQLNSDVTGALKLDSTTLDLNGHHITGDLTVDGILAVFDTATDDYTVADGVYGTITGNVTGNLVAKEGYIAAENGFHKFGGQYISGVSLRPGNAGIYYTATFLCDEVLLSALEMGVAVSLADMPGADFATDEDTLYTVGTTGVMIQNILTGDAEDADRAIMDIYAASYVKLPDGTVLVSENEVAYSLYDVLLLVKKMDSEALDSFLAQWNIQSWFN